MMQTPKIGNAIRCSTVTPASPNTPSTTSGTRNRCATLASSMGPPNLARKHRRERRSVPLHDQVTNTTFRAFSRLSAREIEAPTQRPRLDEGTSQFPVPLVPLVPLGGLSDQKRNPPPRANSAVSAKSLHV